MDNLSGEALEELLSAVGAYLEDEGDSASIVVVGGSSLAIRGWVDRTTQDVDVIAQALAEEKGRRWRLIAPDPLPQPLVAATARVARDFGLPLDWMNTVVGDQWDRGLPKGFSEELEWRRYGALEVGFAGRQSLIALKLHAAVDRDRASAHFQDLVALRPSDDELARAVEWVLSQDGGPDFPALVKEVVDNVRGKSE
jgi:hypothetical protein